MSLATRYKYWRKLTLIRVCAKVASPVSVHLWLPLFLVLQLPNSDVRRHTMRDNGDEIGEHWFTEVKEAQADYWQALEHQ